MKKFIKTVWGLIILAIIIFFVWKWWIGREEGSDFLGSLTGNFAQSEANTDGSETESGKTDGSKKDGFSLSDVLGLLGAGGAESGESSLSLGQLMGALGGEDGLSVEQIMSIAGEVDVKEVLKGVTSGDASALENLKEQFSDVSLDSLADMGLYDIDEQSAFDSSREVYTQELVKTDLGTGLSSLVLNTGGMALQLEQSENEHFYLSGKEYGKLQYYVENNTLYLTAAKTGGSISTVTDGSITLYIPANHVFSSVKLELGAGLVTGNYLEAQTMELKVSMGNLEVKQIKAADLNIELSMGQVIMNTEVASQLTAVNSMGNLELGLKGTEKDYNYKIAGAMGNIKIADTEYSGTISDKSVNNGATCSVDLECSVGNIVVNFVE